MTLIFLYPEEGKRERDGIIQSFIDFVDRVLVLQGNFPIEKVSIKCGTGVDQGLVNGWICNALQRGASELDLIVLVTGFGDNYLLSPQVFISSTLVELKLGSGIKVDGLDGEVFLPVLKLLVLDSVEFCFDQFLMLLRCCPVVKKLEMVNVECEDWDQTVSSASLKSLKIKSESFSFERFSFDTPNLVFLDYSELVAEDYPTVNLENVVNARINLLANEYQIKRAREPDHEMLEEDWEDVFIRFSNAKKLMSGIRNVKKLFMSPTTLELLSLCCVAMPVFNNLTFLAILTLWGLLHCVTDKCGDACDCISRDDKGHSLISCPVKILHIKAFIGTTRELKMIKHFLNLFPCLKEMEIHAEENDQTTFEIPGMFERIVELMKLYNELSSCYVRFMVCDSLYRKWTAQ
ncbi:unnamed protein product [Arabidopsis lyrata]|nr:unnamed protein product [Arabidopsis lyrata]